MTLPTIHSNGTIAKDLIAGYDAIDDALHELIEAWGKVEFNARDYYVKGPAEWPQAVDERQKQSANIRELRDYIQGIRQHLYDHAS